MDVVIGRALSPESIGDLLELAREDVSDIQYSSIGDRGDLPPALVEQYKEYRKNKIVNDTHLLLPETVDEFYKFVNDPNVTLQQFDLLIYEQGHRFKAHRDRMPAPWSRRRKWSTSTLLYESDDLVGGDLLFHKGGDTLNPKLEVGETILFPSDLIHEVTEVKSGRRISLVAWFLENE